MYDKCFHDIAIKKSINMTLKCSKVTSHIRSKPLIKAPFACIHPLPNFLVTLLNSVSPIVDAVDAVI